MTTPRPTRPPKRKPKPRRRTKARATRSRAVPAPKPKPQVAAEEVRLVSGRGSAGHGGEQGGHYWHIYVGETRAGNIFINMIDDEILGRHPSVQIHLNQDQRGRGIGRIAYRDACEQSGYDEVYAHMRKSNAASRRAAEVAGFAPVNDGRIQLSMIWRRPKT